METIDLRLVFWVLFLVATLACLAWELKPRKCPRCGEMMRESDDGTYLYCPKCGRREPISEEAMA